MNKNTLIIVLIFSVMTSYAQISTTKIVEIERSVELYDSMRNFLGDEISKYVGQKIYLMGKREELRKYGYKGFLLDYSNRNTSQSKSNVYKCCDSYGSKYDELVGRYFKVIGYANHPLATDHSIYKNIYYLLIVEEERNDTIFYEYNSEFEHSFPFIVVGFYEKQKKEIVGHKYVFVNRIFESQNDIDTGEKIVIKPNQIWECVDITIDEKDYNLSLLIKNSNGNKTVVPFWTIQNEYRKNAYKYSEVQIYQKKFGLGNWLKILDGEVLVGFTEEMVKLSWGEPNTINRASYGDQWVYDNQYLYFKKGKMTSFN